MRNRTNTAHTAKGEVWSAGTSRAGESAQVAPNLPRVTRLLAMKVHTRRKSTEVPVSPMLFSLLKAMRLHPSNERYGAVVAACFQMLGERPTPEFLDMFKIDLRLEEDATAREYVAAALVVGGMQGNLRAIKLLRQIVDADAPDQGEPERQAAALTKLNDDLRMVAEMVSRSQILENKGNNSASSPIPSESAQSEVTDGAS